MQTLAKKEVKELSGPILRGREHTGPESPRILQLRMFILKGTQFADRAQAHLINIIDYLLSIHP